MLWQLRSRSLLWLALDMSIILFSDGGQQAITTAARSIFCMWEPRLSLYAHVERIWLSVMNMVQWQCLLTVVQRGFISVFLLGDGHKLVECQKCCCCNKQTLGRGTTGNEVTLGFTLNFYIITNLSCGCRKHWEAKSIWFNVFLIVLLGNFCINGLIYLTIIFQVLHNDRDVDIMLKIKCFSSLIIVTYRS